MGDAPRDVPSAADNNTAPVPPQNLDAEESVLGACLLAEGAIGACLDEGLSPLDFYRQTHGLIFAAIVEAYTVRGQAPDAIMLTDQLEQRGELDEAGGRTRIHELASLVPATANAGHYARIVKEMANLRGLIRIGSEIATMGWERPEETARLMERAEQLIYDLTTSRTVAQLEQVKPALLEAFQRMRELAEHPGDVVGLPTGFRTLDRVTLGLERGNMVVLAARPSMGKSALALCVARHATADLGVPIAYFVVEDSKQATVQRLLALQANVDLLKIRLPSKLTSDEWSRLAGGADQLARAPFYVDATAKTVAEIRSKARRQKARTPDLGLVVVDYMQLLVHGPASDVTALTGQVSQQLKMLAKDLEVPVLAISQLSRGLEKRQDKRPTLADLRQSGQIEQDADLVVFLYRDEYYDPETEARGIAELNVAKNRNGPTDTVKLAWKKERAKFTDLEPTVGR